VPFYTVATTGSNAGCSRSIIILCRVTALDRKQTLIATYDKAKVATRLATNVTTPNISPVEARKSHLLTLI
jgi:hypothetical protein